MLPTVRKFTYQGIKRVVIERNEDSRPGAGMLCLEIEKGGLPSNKLKTFKPGQMMDNRRCGVFATLYYTARSLRIG